MKKIYLCVFLIFIVILLSMINNKSIDNITYLDSNDNYHIEVHYPKFNNDKIDTYIKDYVDAVIYEFTDKSNNNGYMYLDYDYNDDKDYNKIIFYKYFNINNKVNIDNKILNIDKRSSKIEEESVTEISIDNDIKQEEIIDPNMKMIALTFDDGPNYNTSKLINVLNKYNVKATFFVLGSKIKGNEKTIETLDNYGMEIGNHTYSHKLLTSSSSDDIINEVDTTNNIIKDITGNIPKLVRPSYGSLNKRIRESINMPIIIWNIDTLDWKNHSSKNIVNRIMKKVSDGDIILMHDVYSATVKAVDIVIPLLIKEGYQIVTVSELFYYKNVKLEKGKVYGYAN